MLNTAELEQLVRDQISKSVNDEIIGLLDSSEWLNSVEESIIDYAQKRVVTKFSNADAMQQILSVVENSVKQLFESGSISSIKELVDEKTLNNFINKELQTQVISFVDQQFQDRTWLINLQRQIVGSITNRFEKEFRTFPYEQKIKEYTEELFRNFSATIEFNGINDQAVTTQLTVLNDAVVVENDLISNNLSVIKDIETQNIKIKGDLILLGDINTDARGWQMLSNAIENRVFDRFQNSSKQSLYESVVEQAKISGIDFANVSIGGSPLVRDGDLSSKIKNTNIERVGNLKELTVLGEADFNNTAFVANKRVGINTREPSSALSVWDEEVEIVVGKRSERTGFIGSTRKQNLQIGVNNKGNITIKDDGLVVIDQLQVGKQRISHGSEVPGYSGSKGDIVFNITIGPKNPVFAWMCIGGFNWVALSASIS